MEFKSKYLPFRRFGKDKHGVIKYTGSVETLKRVWGFSVVGLLICAAGLYYFLTGQYSDPLILLFFFGYGLPCTMIGVCAFLQYRHVTRFSSAEQICAALGMEEATLQQVATERKIKPRYFLNGQPHYDVAEFSDAMILLRATNAPQTTAETLLRPASAFDDSTPEQLLHPSAGEGFDIPRSL